MNVPWLLFAKMRSMTIRFDTCKGLAYLVSIATTGVRSKRRHAIKLAGRKRIRIEVRKHTYKKFSVRKSAFESVRDWLTTSLLFAIHNRHTSWLLR